MENLRALAFSNAPNEPNRSTRHLMLALGMFLFIENLTKTSPLQQKKARAICYSSF
jgi:hypothetical protein